MSDQNANPNNPNVDRLRAMFARRDQTPAPAPEPDQEDGNTPVPVSPERLVSVPKPVTRANPMAIPAIPVIPTRPVYTPAPPVHEETLSLCEDCGTLLPDDDLMEIDGMLLCVECGDKHEREQAQQADEQAEGEARARDERVALVSALAERAEMPTDRDQADDPIVQALASEVIPVMREQAEASVSKAVEIVALAGEAARLIETAEPEQQAQALAVLEPVKQEIEQAKVTSITRRIAYVNPFDGAEGVGRAANAIREYIAGLKLAFVERDDLIDHLAIVTIARMHLAVIGPAGAAKSQVIRMFMRGIADALKASFQGNAFVTPDDLLGPISLDDLERRNIYMRKLDGRLGAVHIYELDEGFRLTSKAFNVLLRALNEREVFNPETVNIPLHSLYVASNDYPVEPELRALRDRFAVRMFVGYVSDDNFKRMIRMNQPEQPPVSVPWSAFERLTEELERLVIANDESLPDGVLDLMLNLRTHLRGENVDVSDRLNKWGVRLMLAKALLDGRTEVQRSDLWVLQHALWDDQKHIAKVRAAIETLVGRLEEDIEAIIARIVSVREAHDKAMTAAVTPSGDPSMPQRMGVRQDTLFKVNDMREELSQLEAKHPMEGAILAKFEQAQAALQMLRNHAGGANQA